MDRMNMAFTPAFREPSLFGGSLLFLISRMRENPDRDSLG